MLSRNKMALLLAFGLLLALVLTACVRPLGDGTDEATNANVNVAATIESSGEESAPDAAGEEMTTGEEAAPAGEPVSSEETAGEEAAAETEAEPAEAAAGEEQAETAVETSGESTAAEDANAGGGTPETAEESAEAVEAEATTEESASETEAAEAGTAEAESTAAEAEVTVTETTETRHVVQTGENLYRIGLKYGVSWVALAQYNQLPNANVIYVGQELKIPGTGPAPSQPEAPTETISYTVVPGDNLFRIGLRFGVSWVEIAEANGIVNPGQIFPGQVLKIPSSAPGPSPEFTHNVLPGETLYTIALRYGVQWIAVAEANKISSPYVIYAGQTLVIPGN